MRLRKASRVPWGKNWAQKSIFCPFENVENAVLFRLHFFIFPTHFMRVLKLLTKLALDFGITIQPGNPTDYFHERCIVSIVII